MSNKFQAIKKIQQLTPQQLADCLILNGYNECTNFITTQNISGEEFLNLTELQLNRSRSQISPVHIKRLWSFITRIKDYPQEFILPERKISNTKPYNQGITKSTETNDKNEAIKKANITLIQSKLESCLKLKPELFKQEPQEEEQIYENGPIINSVPPQIFSEVEAIYGNDSFIEETPMLPPRKQIENTPSDILGGRKVSPTTHIYPNEQFFRTVAMSKSSNAFIPPATFTPQTAYPPSTAFTPPATSPSAFPPVNEDNSDDLPGYSECDDDGYLLASEVLTPQEEENIYEPEPMANRNLGKAATTIINRPPPIRHRPLPEVPKKKFIEEIQEQKTQEALRKALLDRKHSLDKKEPRKSPLMFENKTPEKPVATPFLAHSRDFESEDVAHPGNEGHKVYRKSDLQRESSFRNTDRKGADILLSNLEDGAFLLRPSRRFFCTLSIKYGPRLYNVGIVFNEADNTLRCNEHQSPLFFKSAKMLIEYYTAHTLSVYDNQKQLINIKLKDVLPRDMF